MSAPDLKLAVIGTGQMGLALIGGLARAGFADGGQILAYDLDAKALERAAAQGALPCASADDAVRQAGQILLAVKPGQVAEACRAIARAGSPRKMRAAKGAETVPIAHAGDSKLVISIAAGVTTETLAREAGAAARIIRAMPNVAATVGQGATAIFCGPGAGPGDEAVARRIFDAAGITVTIASEPLMDAVTGLSGSGPAYVFVLLEALADGGVAAGLPRDIANQLAVATVLGSAALARDSGAHFGALKDRVTSPGGTTIAGLEVLEAHGFRGAVLGAVKAAAARAGELGDGKKRS